MKRKVATGALAVMLVWLLAISTVYIYMSIQNPDLSEFKIGFFNGSLLGGCLLAVIALVVLVRDKSEDGLPKTPGQNYAMVGLGLATFGIFVFALQLTYGYVLTRLFGEEIVNKSWFQWIQVIVPTYVVGFLALCALCSKVEKTPLEQHKMTIWQYICCVFMNAAIVGVGTIIGAIVNGAILKAFGGENTVALAELMLNSDDFWRILTVGIGAPVFEELIFRKLLIDRIHKYGEGMAILISGVLFGLFHGNFSQMFFAMGLGFFFAYIYIRTGKIWYTIGFHMIINLSTSVITVKILKCIDLELLDRISVMDPMAAETQALTMQILPQMLLLIGWYLILILFVLVGIILWILKAKKLYLVKQPLQQDKKMSTAFGNFGMICFLVLCVVLFWQYYLSMICG